MQCQNNYIITLTYLLSDHGQVKVSIEGSWTC